VSVPLSILDLAPVSSGSTPARALRNTITHAHADRVRSCELLAKAWGDR